MLKKKSELIQIVRLPSLTHDALLRDMGYTTNIVRNEFLLRAEELLAKMDHPKIKELIKENGIEGIEAELRDSALSVLDSEGSFMCFYFDPEATKTD